MFNESNKVITPKYEGESSLTSVATNAVRFAQNQITSLLEGMSYRDSFELDYDQPRVSKNVKTILKATIIKTWYILDLSENLNPEYEWTKEDFSFEEYKFDEILLSWIQNKEQEDFYNKYKVIFSHLLIVTEDLSLINKEFLLHMIWDNELKRSLSDVLITLYSKDRKKSLFLFSNKEILKKMIDQLHHYIYISMRYILDTWFKNFSKFQIDYFSNALGEYCLSDNFDWDIVLFKEFLEEKISDPEFDFKFLVEKYIDFLLMIWKFDEDLFSSIGKRFDKEYSTWKEIDIDILKKLYTEDNWLRLSVEKLEEKWIEIVDKELYKELKLSPIGIFELDEICERIGDWKINIDVEQFKEAYKKAVDDRLFFKNGDLFDFIIKEWNSNYEDFFNQITTKIG